MEACGLKYSIINGRYQDKMSRLMEACGLKCLVHALLLGLGLVTPYGGVWIEISNRERSISIT